MQRKHAWAQCVRRFSRTGRTSGRAGLGALAAAWIVTAAAAGGEVRGIPTVIDGDTLELAGRLLRLQGVDAPELDQRCWLKSRLYDCGRVARTALLDLTAGTEVVCSPVGPGLEGTTLAQCTAGGYDLSEGMAYTGWALSNAEAKPRYRAVEAGAREAGRGLWRGRFVKPWDWRAGARLPEEDD